MEPKKKNLSRKSYSLISLILACTAPLFAAALSVTVVKFYETDVQYFKLDTPWFGVLVGALIIVGIAAFALSLTQKKDSLPDSYPFGGTAPVSASVIAGVTLLLFAFGELRILLNTEVYNAGYEYVTGFARLFANRFNTVSAIAAICAIIAAVYFLIPALTRYSKRNIRVVFGFAVVIFFILRLLVLYYDTATPINSPLRMFDQMANVSAMIFFVYELRFLLDDPKPRLYIPFAVLAFIMLATISTAQIIGSIFLEGFTFSLYAMIFELALALYIFANLTGYLAICKNYAYVKPQKEDAPVSDKIV